MEESKRGNKTNHPSKLFAKRDMTWRTIRVDEYTHDLIMQAIDEGKGMSKVQVINKGMCSLLGIPYKDDEQLRIERRMEYSSQVIAANFPKTQEEIEDAAIKYAEDILRQRQERAQKRELSPEEMEELRKAQELADEKYKQGAPAREARRKEQEAKQAYEKAKAEAEAQKKINESEEI